MNQQKLNFIKNELMPLLTNLPANAVGKWGLMNGQQMVEHLSLIFNVSSGKTNTTLQTPENLLPQYKEFLWSDKEFRENTKAPNGIIPDEPSITKHASMQQSLQELQDELDYFFDYFEQQPDRKTMHPAFGNLNFEEWIQIHHKHLVHHLKQFDLMK